MKAFIKENLSLVVALALPVLFAGFFLLSKQVGAPTAPPPKHDFVMIENYYRNNTYYQFQVIDGAIKVQFTYPKPDERGNVVRTEPPKMYYVQAKDMVAERIDLNLPADAFSAPAGKALSSVEIPVPRFGGKTFKASTVSPDGYELRDAYYRSGNLMTEIFASGQRRERGPSLQNGGSVVEIRGINNAYGMEVLGWVTDGHE